jgi:hypothetical protein
MADTNTPAERAEAGGTDRTTDAARLMTGGETGGTASANRSRTSSDLRPRKNAANEADVLITEGGLYREKNGTQEVVPFFVDFATARVRFSPVGRSSEDEMRMGEFLNRFEEVDKSVLAEATASESQKKAEARMKKRESTDQLGRVIARDGEPV